MNDDILATLVALVVTLALFLVRHLVLTVGKSKKQMAVVSGSKRQTLGAVRSREQANIEEPHRQRRTSRAG